MTQYILENVDDIVFKDMSDEDKLKIINMVSIDNTSVEVLCEDEVYRPMVYTTISVFCSYRIKAKATPLSIPWEHIKPEYKWAAMDYSGSILVYRDKPVIKDGQYYWKDSNQAVSLAVLNINTDNINWELSLTKLPDNI